VRLFPPDLPALELAKHFGVVDAVAIGMVTFVWVAMLTVAIACAIVCVMKGPGYVADGYSVSDRDTPADD
ncbi:MAG TPA: hypothetical protein VLW45_11785, partial [Pelomicrobium sp.]|nr:hypothetical protein [Pelomicrobium sp.]